MANKWSILTFNFNFYITTYFNRKAGSSSGDSTQDEGYWIV